MAALAGDKDLAASARRSQLLAAVRALEIFVCLALPECRSSNSKPFFLLFPHFQERIIFFLPLGGIPGEHAENRIDVKGIGDQGQRPEPRELRDERNREAGDEQNEVQRIRSVAPVHKSSQLFQKHVRTRSLLDFTLISIMPLRSIFKEGESSLIVNLQFILSRRSRLGSARTSAEISS